jgi:hypothetical protein
LEKKVKGKRKHFWMRKDFIKFVLKDCSKWKKDKMKYQKAHKVTKCGSKSLKLYKRWSL